jgi:anthranilate phosphoribosyltransferase
LQVYLNLQIAYDALSTLLEVAVMTDINILQSDPEHPFAQYVRILGKGKKGSRSLTEEEAFDAMSMILQKKVEEVQIGAFLMLLRVKEESPEELSGFVKAVQAQINVPKSLHVDLDWSSYAGKRRHLPWFIFSILLLNQAGYKVFIHGVSGHTHNRLYTEQVLQELGFETATNWEEANNLIAKNGFAYMALSHISPLLAELINLRHILGLRSPVHSLSRLINPLNADIVLQGIFHPAYSGLHQQAGKLLKYKTLAVIKGEGGEIERNPDTATAVKWSSNNEMGEEEWPAYFPRRHVKPQELSIEHMKAIWSNAADDEYAVGAIQCTCAFALKYLKPTLTQEEAIEEAITLWNNRNFNYFV